MGALELIALIAGGWILVATFAVALTTVAHHSDSASERLFARHRVMPPPPRSASRTEPRPGPARGGLGTAVRAQ